MLMVMVRVPGVLAILKPQGVLERVPVIAVLEE